MTRKEKVGYMEKGVLFDIHIIMKIRGFENIIWKTIEGELLLKSLGI